jgi:hypothetical protein
VNICFAAKYYQMRHIEFPMFDPCFLWGYWIMNFGWALIFYWNCYVQYFCLKLQIKILHKNPAFNAFHNCFIGFFHNAILLWWIWINCLLVDSTFIQEGIKFFGNKIFDLHARFVFHQRIIYFEYFSHLSFDFQNIKKRIFYECDKISGSTMDYLKPTNLGLRLPSYLPI